jgi:hypothetical protein
VKCTKCQREFPKRARAQAGISVFVLGDEYIYSYWLCPACDHYTVEAYHDRFLGDDEVFFLAPVSRKVGDRAVALIRACPSPFDKYCDCPSHRALYHGVPSEPAAK